MLCPLTLVCPFMGKERLLRVPPDLGLLTSGTAGVESDLPRVAMPRPGPPIFPLPRQPPDPQQRAWAVRMDGQPSLGRAACLLSTEDTFTTGVHKINNCTFCSQGPWHKGPGGPIKGPSLHMSSVLPLGPGLPWTREEVNPQGFRPPRHLGKWEF